jgi:uncharacterized LabA/DUF88 family protein
MSQNVGVFVDVSNLFYSAKSAGVEVNYCRLLDCAVSDRDLIRACAYTGVDPDNPNQRKFIDFLRANGYKVVCKDIHKYEGGRIKANLDIEMAVDIMLLSENLDVVVLVSGDGDFVRLIDAVQMKGVRCEVISFGISTSNELIEAADQFTEISTLTGIFRNAPSGPNVHVRGMQQQASLTDGRNVYTYSSVSVNAYQLPSERRGGTLERPHGQWDRDPRQQPQHIDGNNLGPGQEPQARGAANGSPSPYSLGAHHDFVMPEDGPCLDTHSVPLTPPESVKQLPTNGHE